MEDYDSKKRPEFTDASDFEPHRLTRDTLLARNFAINLFGQIVPLAVAFAAIPPLIAALGPERFGILSLAWIFVGYFSLFDFGLGRALTQILAQQIGSGETEEASVYIWTSLALMGGLGIIGSVVIVVGAGPMVDSGLKLSPGLRNEAQFAIILLAAAIPLVIVTSGLQGVLSAVQRFDLVNIIRVPLALFNYVGPLIILPFAATVPAVIAVLVVGRFLATVVYFIFCVQVFPGLHGYPRMRASLIQPLLGLGGWMTVTNIVGPVMLYMDRFLIGTLAVISTVAYYTTPYEIVSRVLLIPVALISVLFPAFTTSFTHNPVRTAVIFERSVKYIFLIMFPLLFSLAIFAHEGLLLWLGQEFADRSTLVLQLLALGFFLNSLSQAPFALIQGLGRPDLTARMHLIELPFYLVALWLLVQQYGIAGAAIAWTLRAAADMVLLFVLSRGMLVANHRFYLYLAASIAAAGAAFLGSLLIASVVLRLTFALLLLLIYIPIAWLYVLSGEERTGVMTRLRRYAVVPEHP